MSTLGDIRTAIAQAVIDCGLPCLPYEPDNLVPPAGFIQSLTVAFDAAAGGWFTGQRVSIAVALLEVRSDTGASQAALEERVPAVVTAISDLGVAVETVSSGSVEVGGQSLPGVILSLSANVS